MDSIILLILSILFISIFLCFCIIYLIKYFVSIRNDINYIEKHSNPDKLYKEYKKILDKNPEDYTIRYKLAQLEEYMGLLKEARESYLSLIDVPIIIADIDNSFLYSKAEDLSIRMNEKEDALRYLIRLCEINPANKEYSLRLGMTLVKEGFPQFAKPYLDKFITESGDFDLMKTLAFMYYKLHEYKKCVVCLENIYKLLTKEYTELKNVEGLLLNMYITAEEYFQAKSFAEFILGKRPNPESVYNIFRTYLFVLYRLNDRNKFIEYYGRAVKNYSSSNLNKEHIDLILDLGFYSYFLGYVEKAMDYFVLAKNSQIPQDIDLDKAIEYLKKMESIDIEYKMLEKDIYTKFKKKDITKRYQDYITEEEKNSWDKIISIWETSITYDNYINTFVNVIHTFDVERVLKEEAVKTPVYNDVQKTLVKRLFEIDRIYEVPFKTFTNACQNIVKSKLRYFIQQEIIPSGKHIQEGDGIDYLAYAQKGTRNDLTLIAFRRWRSETVGELVLRDFIISVREANAKKGILFIPVELSKAAYGYASNSEILRVYSRWEFNNFLRGEKL